MKLHLQPKFTISNIPPKINPITHKDLFIYYTDNTLIIVDLPSNKILHKFKYDDVQIIKIHRENLYVCSNDIHILDLDKFQVIDVLKLSKALVSNIEFHNDCMLIARTNNRITYIHNRRVCFEVQTDNYVDKLFINESYFGYHNLQEAVAYSNRNIKIADLQSEQIVGIHACDTTVYVLESDGTFTDLISKKVIDLQIEIDSCVFDDSYFRCIKSDMVFTIAYNGEIIDQFDINQKIQEYSGELVDFYSAEGCLLEDHSKLNKRVKSNKSSISDEDVSSEDIVSSEYIISGEDFADDEDIVSGEDFDDENIVEESHDENDDGEDDDLQYDDENSNDENANDEDSLEFSFVGSSLIKTSENDFIFLENSNITKIISFADDLTGSVYFKDFLILTTSSGYLKFTSTVQCKTVIQTESSAPEYILNSNLLKIHQNSIIGCKLHDDILITGGKDRLVNIFRIEDCSGTIKLTKVFEFSSFKAGITALDYCEGILAVATEDFIIHIFKTEEKYQENVIDEYYTRYFSTFENISVQKIHSKSINHIQILSNPSQFIITSSSDKSSKILDFNGSLIKEINSDKILNSSSNSKYISICSHKTAKIFTNPSLSQVCAFQVRKPILSSCFYNGYFLGISDVLRIYDMDKRKCVKSYDLELSNCWNFSFPYLCAENKIVFLEDISNEHYEKTNEAMRIEKENSILFERFMINGQFSKALDVLLNKTGQKMSVDQKKVFNVISQGYFRGNIEFLGDFMKNGETKAKIFDILLKNTSFKGSLVFNEVVSRFYREKIDKKMKEKVRDVIRKHVESIDGVFIDLYGLNSSNKF